ncbi:MAG: alpha/beta hydrolase family protein [Sphingomonadales bacterium]
MTFATERREVIYFDPDLAQIASALERAIPQLPQIRFVDSSQDESRLLIWAGSDTDPGRFLLFDRRTKRLDDLMDVRPMLAGVPLASVKPVTYKAADGTPIPAYLTLPPGREDAKGLPAIVMPHGGPSSRDEWGFDWLSQYFANRGFAVLQPNFRGSAGYGESWFLKKGFQSWRTAIGDVDDGARWLVSQGIADPKKLAIVGWSYGGYAALQSAVAEPGLFGAVVAIAPVTDLEMLKNERQNWSNYRRAMRLIGTGDTMTTGSPAHNAAKIKVPVLIFHGTFDRNVGIRESRLMDSRLKDAGGKSELVIYEKLDHQLEDGKARADMLAKSDAFLRASLGL